MSVSVLTLTLNEEINLPACLESVKWCDDIVVFDSYSTDQTVEIAKAAGARVVQREFDNYASQRNAALSEVRYRYPWVLMIDADERVTPELFREIKSVIEQVDGNTHLLRLRRKDIFLGRWLRRSSGYPTWFGRLIRIGYVKVMREINEEYQSDGKVGSLQEHLVHYPFNKGTSHWFERHNLYSSMEASVLTHEIFGNFQFSNLFSRDPATKRKSLKQLAYRLPGRPFIVFCYLYLFRCGFLDGRAGLIYCVLRSFYEVMIDLKVMEIRRREQGLPI